MIIIRFIRGYDPKKMGTINIQYLLFSVHTGKTGQVMISIQCCCISNKAESRVVKEIHSTSQLKNMFFWRLQTYI